VIVAAVLLAAAPLPAADAATLSRRIATAKVQPTRALADALAQFDRQFAASYAHAAGRAATPVQKRRLARMRAAGRAELTRLMNTDALPWLMTLTERDYRDHYSAAELAAIAAFWTSPAGAALGRAMQQAGAKGGTLTLPAEHRDAIAAYLSSPAGQKESARSAALQTAMARSMTAFLQRAQPRISARIAAAGQ
jgi:hypothetical protein